MKKEILVSQDGKKVKISADAEYIVNEFSWIVNAVVKNRCFAPSRYVDDVKQDLFLTLLKVFDRYDIEKGCTFGTYAYATLSRDVIKKSKKYYKCDSDISFDDMQEYYRVENNISDNPLLSVGNLLTDGELNILKLKYQGYTINEIVAKGYSKRLYYSAKKKLGGLNV